MGALLQNRSAVRRYVYGGTGPDERVHVIAVRALAKVEADPANKTVIERRRSTTREALRWMRNC